MKMFEAIDYQRRGRGSVSVVLAGVMAMTTSACGGTLLRRGAGLARAVATGGPTWDGVMRQSGIAVLVSVMAISTSACSQVMLHRRGAERPPTSEFGFGPRASLQRHYTVTLQPREPLRPRQMQTIRVTIADSEGQAIDGAAIAVDGGMPEHRHGLPTRPRMTKRLGGGLYEIDGVRFNMGGWWELKLAITAAAGADSVTFNLNL